MKFASLILLVLICLFSAANLFNSFGLLPLSLNQEFEYRAFAGIQIDRIGYRKLARDNGIEIGDEDRIKFPNEMREQLAIINMIPFTIAAIEEDGWDFVAVIPLATRAPQVLGRMQGQDMTLAPYSSPTDNIYLFRKLKGKKTTNVNVEPVNASEPTAQSPSGS